MPKTIKIKIESSVLKWARESIGLTIDDVVQHFSLISFVKLKIDKEFIVLMEKTPQEISFRVIREFAKFYKRPVSSFFLRRPLTEDPHPKDFRTISSHMNKQLTKNTLLMIRRVRRVQEVTREMYEDLGIKYKFNFNKISLDSNPSEIAKYVRNKLGFSISKQQATKDPGKLFNLLRDIIEESGVIVLKGSFPVEDARAFSFVDKKPYVIVINSKDGNETGYAPKLFSLLHEYAHILLRESAMCNDFEYSHMKIEKYCNQFAGDFLLPKEDLIEILPIKLKSKINLDNIGAILKDLRIKFKVSEPVALRRMYTLNYINKEFYEKVRKISQKKYEDYIKLKGKPFIPPLSQDKKALNNYGKLFTRLVLEAQFSNRITSSSTTEYLSIKSKYIPDLYNLALNSL